jgi:hypothetical protein
MEEASAMGIGGKKALYIYILEVFPFVTDRNHFIIDLSQVGG